MLRPWSAPKGRAEGHSLEPTDGRGRSRAPPLLSVHGRPVPRRLDRSGDTRANGDRRLRQHHRADRFADDARGHRRHDRVGQDRARRRPDRGGAPGRAAGAGDRPEGRSHQPAASRSPTSLRPTSARGSTRPRPPTPARPRTRSPPARQNSGATASASGASPVPTSARSAPRPTSRSTRPDRRPACRSTSSAHCRCPPT